MPRKRYQGEGIIHKLREAEVAFVQGKLSFRFPLSRRSSVVNASTRQFLLQSLL
nr:hypothetical protein [Rubripirellula sp.]